MAGGVVLALTLRRDRDPLSRGPGRGRHRGESARWSARRASFSGSRSTARRTLRAFLDSALSSRAQESARWSAIRSCGSACWPSYSLRGCCIELRLDFACGRLESIRSPRLGGNSRRPSSVSRRGAFRNVGVARRSVSRARSASIQRRDDGGSQVSSRWRRRSSADGTHFVPRLRVYSLRRRRRFRFNSRARKSSRRNSSR